MWDQLLAQITNKPSMSWVHSFSLKNLDRGVAQLVAEPGNREILKFVTPPRRDQLAALLATVIGKPIRVELELPPTFPTIPPPKPGVEAPRNPAPGISPGTSPSPPADRTSRLQHAMALPLVKRVMEVFDAQIMDVRPEDETPTSTPVSTDGAAIPDAAAPDEPTLPGLPSFQRRENFEPEMEEE